MKYSVIIVSYKCLEQLQRCIQSVITHSKETEIIVVDNCSDDGTQEYLSHDNQLIVIQNEVNQGFSKACNQGSEVATGDILVFLNPDTVVTHQWLEHLSDYLNLPNVAAVGPTSNYVAGLQKVQAHFQGPWNGLEQLDNFAQELYLQNQKKGVRTKLLIGFCLMIPRTLFESLGRMDEDLFLGNDDLDLSWRIQIAGGELVVATDVFIFHEGQKSFQAEPNEKVSQLVQESTDGLYRKLIKHYGSKENVPSSEELWGMNWFQPNSNNENIETKPTLKGTEVAVPSIVFYRGKNSEVFGEGKTLQTLSDFQENDLVYIDHSGVKENHDIVSGLKLEIPVSQSFRTVLKKSVSLCENEYLFFVQPGVEISKLAQQFIQNSSANYDNLIFPIVGTNSNLQKGDFPPLAFLASKKWLVHQMNKWDDNAFHQEFINCFDSISEKMRVPHLIYKGISSDSDVAQSNQLANQEMDFEQLPYNLRKHVKDSEYPVFVNSNDARSLDIQGQAADISKADLIVYRVFNAFDQGLPMQLRALKRQGTQIKKLILLVLPYKVEQDAAIPENKSKSVLMELDKIIWENQFNVQGFQSYNSEKEITYQEQPNKDQAGFQIVCSPRSNEATLNKKVSIILLGFNQVAFSKKCIESIKQHTKQNYELILVDNGSDDQTNEYFKQVEGATVISNQENLGVAKGWNQAMEKATGDYLLIFNNDTIVTPNWLENMVRLAESNSGIGIIGPRSNNISGPQVTPDLNIKTETDIFSVAQKWQQENDLSAMPFERITGFCMLISRAAYEKIGFFDERFGKGNFEDDDYCLRAKYLGYRLMIANDSFVFHFGSVSYSHDSVDWKRLMQQNANKFQEKWKDGQKGLDDTYKENTDLNVKSLIQKAFQNYEDNNLNQARLLFLKAVEADPKLSEGYNGLGIIAFHDNNYADALTLFRKALELDPSDMDVSSNILDLLDASCNPEERFQCLNALMVDFANNTVFKSAIEKQSPVAPPPEKPNWRDRVEVLIREKRYQEALDNIEPQLKTDRDLATCFNYLGIISYECHDLEAAWKHFKRSLEINLLDEDVLINFFDTGISIGKEKEVLSTFESVFDQSETDHNFSEIKQSYHQLKLAQKRKKWDAQNIISNREKNIAGENLIREGMLDKAWTLFGEVLKNDPENFRAFNNLGLLSWYHEDAEKSWEFFTRALSVNPSYGDALINSFDVALCLKKIHEYEPYLERFLEADPKNKEALEIQTHIKKGDSEIYNIKKFEDIDPVIDKLSIAEEALDQGNHNAATLNFLEVLENRPDCSTAYNGLGVVAFQKKMYKEAFKLVQLAVELNPLNGTHLMNLWEISKVLGNESDVIERLSSALQIDPSLQEIKEVVDSYPV